jgi:NADPH:quinone reductase-like Zn-dependent oxidoreductase
MKVYEIQNSFGLDSVKVAERPEPKPASGQVLLRMKAWSLNYRDLLVAKGQYNPRLKLPLIPLSDGVGEVVEVGAGVTRVRAGDRVAGAFMPGWVEGRPTDAKTKTALGGGVDGLLAEYAVLPGEGVVKVPPHLTDEEAATLPCAAVTAWNALVASGDIHAGDTVLTQGTGGVSLFALQFARLSGAAVIATSSSDAKLARALQMGAAHGINYKTNPDWEKKVLELTGNVGADHVVEVGGAGTLPRSFKAVRTGGTVSLIGILSGVGEVNPLPILMKGVRVQGIYVGSRAMFEDMNRAITLHQMRPVIDRVFPFSQAREALKHMESASHFGKIVIRSEAAA